MVDKIIVKSWVRRIRWAGRIVCLIITLFGGTILIGGVIDELLSDGFTEISLAGVLLLCIGAVALAGCILSWWRDLLSGLLLVITSAGLGMHIGTFAGRNHIVVWLMLGFPYLVAGLLLLVAWRLARH